MKKSDILLVLDLDETLIHSSEKLLNIKNDFKFEQYFVYNRPFLNEFLTDISSHYRIAIWSSGDDDYVNEIVSAITPNNVQFEFVWGRSKCTIKRDFDYENYDFEKRLDKLKKKGYSLEKILIVDDSPEKTRNNYGNAIYIKEYCGDNTDQELKFLYNYLIQIKDTLNVRTLEKRGWRQL